MKRLYSLTVLLLGLAVVAGPPARAQVDDYRDIDFPPLAEFEIPEPQVFDLPNGMKIFLLEDHELPLINLTARIRTGSLYEPADKVGLASMAGTVQRTGGTRSMSGDEIDDFLEARAASVETGIGGGVGFASMDSLAGDFDDVLPVFVEVLRYPEFSQDKIDLAKVQANTGIARRNDSVGAITGREFAKLIYGEDSPLATTAEYATIEAITRDDLQQWHARFYHPNNIYIGVVGDFDSAEMRRTLTEAFGDWERGPEFDAEVVQPVADEKAGVYFIEKSDVTQASIRMGHLGITYDNPDYFPVVVMNEVLGGGFSARLFSRIRSEKGLAYNVGGRVGASFLHPGMTSFSMSTKSESMGEAVDALYEEVEGMISEPATERELELAKESLLNSFIFNYASKGQVLGQQMLFTYYGLPLDFLEKYRDNIEKVTREEVNRVAKQYLHPDRAQLLVVGKAADFDRPMSSFGEVTEIDITIPPQPAREPALEVTDATLAAGAELLAQMAGTIAGEGAAGLDAFRTVDSVVVSMQGQTMALQQESVLALPDRIHVILRLPGGEQAMMVSEGRGFQTFQGQSREMPADQVERQLADLNRNLLYLARYSEAEGLEAVAAGVGEVDGAACDWVQVTLEGTSSRLCVDADGLVTRQTYQSVHPFTGAPGNFEVTYSDYREVNGFLVPHRQVTTIDGDEFATLTRESVEINPTVDPVLFERPAA
jgi:predicted Zn-dependent peptidase